MWPVPVARWPVTRKAIETQTGVPVITSKNAAQLSEVVTNLLEDAGDKDEYITKDYNTV